MSNFFLLVSLFHAKLLGKEKKESVFFRLMQKENDIIND